MQARLSALVETPRRYWRYFIFAWCWPLLLYAAQLYLSSRAALSELYFWGSGLVGVATFLLFALLASAPYRRRQISLSQAVLWIVVVPTVVFYVIAFMPLQHPLTLTISMPSN